jgi:predicted ribosome quality control (RQC) complex YloA/Tae2 family protein
MPAEHYCLECASKHVGTAKILLREALQRAEKGEAPELVLEKVRGAYEELMGAEDDTMSVSDDDIRKLNSMIRDLRKWFFTSGVIVKPDKNLIAEAYAKTSQLNNVIYDEYARRLEKAIESMERVEAKMEALKEAMKARGARAESVEALERAEAKLKELKESMKAKLEEVKSAKLEVAQAG